MKEVVYFLVHNNKYIAIFMDINNKPLQVRSFDNKKEWKAFIKRLKHSCPNFTYELNAFGKTIIVNIEFVELLSVEDAFKKLHKNNFLTQQLKDAL